MKITSGPSATKILLSKFSKVNGQPLFTITIKRRSAQSKAIFAKEWYMKNKNLTWEIKGSLFPDSLIDLEFMRFAFDQVHDTPSSSSYFTKRGYLLKEVNNKKQIFVLTDKGDFFLYHFTNYEDVEKIVGQIVTFTVGSLRGRGRITTEEARTYWDAMPCPTRIFSATVRKRIKSFKMDIPKNHLENPPDIQ